MSTMLTLLVGVGVPTFVWPVAGVVRTVEVTREEPIPAALCGLLLMSGETSERLFRDTEDTWLGPADDDPL